VNRVSSLFLNIESSISAQFETSKIISHSGDKGENREQFLIDFLSKHLPKRYGVVKGQVINKHGEISHAIDIIIYDAVNSPLFFSEKTAILPVEGVYGIIEVKSSLSKSEFLDAASKIDSFKKMAPRDLGVIATDEYVTVHRSSRPFGVVFGYGLSDNSLDSLSNNWREQCNSVYDVNYFVNYVFVLKQGLLRYEKINFSTGEKDILISTDEFVDLVLSQKQKESQGMENDEIILKIVKETMTDGSFGRFFVYLLILLGGMKLNVPDLSQYIDNNLPIMVVRN